MKPARDMRGATLVELVITIVILSMAATALLGVMSFVAKGSADALVMQQAEAIANGYLQRALATPFAGLNALNGLNHPDARDGAGAVVPGLQSYSVGISVQNTGLLGGIPAVDARRIIVTVTQDNGLVVTATGYKTNYTP